MRRLLPIIRTAIFTPAGAAGAALCALVLFLAIAGPEIAPDNPNAVNLADRLSPPSAAHWFGTDELGRDIFSRVLDGASRTVVAAVIVVAVATVVGLAVGILAGYLGGWLDAILMRITDIFIGYPALLFAMAIAAALGVGLTQTIIALAVVWWAGYARLVRGQARAVRHLMYVEAAYLAGASRPQIMRSHILPNVLGPVIVKATLDVALVVEAVAALGFIGLGVQPPAAEWGSMIAESQNYAINAWWYPTFPGLALLIVVLGSNLLGDSIAKALGQGRRGSRLGRFRLRVLSRTPVSS
jgi:peptide/nickel transport system permease protein